MDIFNDPEIVNKCIDAFGIELRKRFLVLPYDAPIVYGDFSFKKDEDFGEGRVYEYLFKVAAKGRLTDKRLVSSAIVKMFKSVKDSWPSGVSLIWDGLLGISEEKLDGIWKISITCTIHSFIPNSPLVKIAEEM